MGVLQETRLDLEGGGLCQVPGEPKAKILLFDISTGSPVLQAAGRRFTVFVERRKALYPCDARVLMQRQASDLIYRLLSELA